MNITIRDIQLNQQDCANKQAQAENARIAQDAKQQTAPKTRNIVTVLSQNVIK
jgi:hypothetical protein